MTDKAEEALYEYEQRDEAESEVYQRKRRKCICMCLPKRYLVAILSFFGGINAYSLRVTLSVGMVAMVSNTTEKVYVNGTEIVHVVAPAEFDWDTKLQGFLLSSFFYGFIVTGIPGGWLSGKIGGTIVYGGGILGTAVATIVMPGAARISPYLVAVLSVIQGLFAGVVPPCIHAIWSKWAPPMEKNRLVTISLSGPFAGIVIGMPLSGLIAELFGWQWVFYVFGIFGVVWSVFWFWLVTELPRDHPSISDEELEYIESSLGSSVADQRLGKTPWLKFVKSKALWAIIVAHFVENWGVYTMLTQLPTYVKAALDFTLEEVGFISALPYLTMAIVAQIGGRSADYLNSKHWFSRTTVRKLFNSIGFSSQTIFLLLVAFAPSKTAAIVGLTLAIGLGGLTYSGFPVNHLDLAPKYASTLFGISNCIATFPGILTPLLVGFMTKNGTREEWRQVFIINASMYAFGLIWYAIFASGEKEPWADGISSQDNTRENDDLEKLLSSKEESPRKRGNYHSDKID